MRTRTESENGWLGLIFLLITALWGAAIFTVMLASLPFAVVNVSRDFKKNFVYFLPEGWGFFTKNPREPNILIYEKKGTGWELLSLPTAHAYLGASRRLRSQSAELATLVTPIKQDAWRVGSGDYTLWKSDTFTTLVNPTASPTLCGHYLLRQQAPIPWAWSRFQTARDAPAKYIEVNILCNR